MLDTSNVFASGATVTNSGNANNLIMREVSSGSVNQLKIGGDPSLAILEIDPTTGDFAMTGNLTLNNEKSFRIENAAGTPQIMAYLSSGDDIQFGYDNGSGNFTSINSGTGGVYLGVNGVSITQAGDTYFRPQADNATALGTSGQRWSVVYAGSGTINTSDERQKQQIRELSDAERAVAIRVKGLLRAFKFNDAVEKKGDGARIHFGVIAQDMKAAFEAEGLDGFKYAVLCYDEWEARDELWSEHEVTPAVFDADGNEIKPPVIERTLIHSARPAGNSYGVRYDELLAFVIAAL